MYTSECWIGNLAAYSNFAYLDVDVAAVCARVPHLCLAAAKAFLSTVVFSTQQHQPESILPGVDHVHYVGHEDVSAGALTPPLQPHTFDAKYPMPLYMAQREAASARKCFACRKTAYVLCHLCCYVYRDRASLLGRGV